MPIGPADPDATDRYLREVMGLTDEGMEDLRRRAAESKRSEAALNEAPQDESKQKPGRPKHDRR